MAEEYEIPLSASSVRIAAFSNLRAPAATSWLGGESASRCVEKPPLQFQTSSKLSVSFTHEFPGWEVVSGLRAPSAPLLPGQGLQQQRARDLSYLYTTIYKHHKDTCRNLLEELPRPSIAWLERSRAWAIPSSRHLPAPIGPEILSPSRDGHIWLVESRVN